MCVLPKNTVTENKSLAFSFDLDKFIYLLACAFMGQSIIRFQS